MTRLVMPLPMINKVPRTKDGFKKKANGKRADAEPRPAYFTSNMRLGNQAKARLTKVWREAGLDAAKQWSIPKHGAGKFFCLVTVHHPINTDYDPMNWYPAAKAMVDGMIGDYGFLPDDSFHHLVGPLCVKGEAAGTGNGRLVVEFFNLGRVTEVHQMNEALARE